MPKTLDFRNPHLLRSDAEYQAALREVEDLMGRKCAPGSKDHDRVQFLAVLIEQYEDEEFPMPEVGPQAVVEFMLEQRGMSRSDLAAILGGKSRVSEFLAKKRDLSLTQVRTLRDALGISADLLIAR